VLQFLAVPPEWSVRDYFYFEVIFQSQVISLMGMKSLHPYVLPTVFAPFGNDEAVLAASSRFMPISI
jgi:hypothetical protein